MHSQQHSLETKARIAASVRQSWLRRDPERARKQAYEAFRAALWALNAINVDDPYLKLRIVEALIEVAPPGEQGRWMRPRKDLAAGRDVGFLIDLNRKPSSKRAIFDDPEWVSFADKVETWLHFEKRYTAIEKDAQEERDSRSLPRFRAEMLAKYGTDDGVLEALALPTKADAARAAQTKHEPGPRPVGRTVVRVDSHMRPVDEVLAD